MEVEVISVRIAFARHASSISHQLDLRNYPSCRCRTRAYCVFQTVEFRYQAATFCRKMFKWFGMSFLHSWLCVEYVLIALQASSDVMNQIESMADLHPVASHCSTILHFSRAPRKWTVEGPAFEYCCPIHQPSFWSSSADRASSLACGLISPHAYSYWHFTGLDYASFAPNSCSASHTESLEHS